MSHSQFHAILELRGASEQEDKIEDALPSIAERHGLSMLGCGLACGCILVAPLDQWSSIRKCFVCPYDVLQALDDGKCVQAC